MRELGSGAWEDVVVAKPPSPPTACLVTLQAWSRTCHVPGRGSDLGAQ